jgi:hypothetical protein
LGALVGKCWFVVVVVVGGLRPGASADAAEDAAADAAEYAADVDNRTAEAETVTSQRLSKGTTIGTTSGHAGTMCLHGITAEPAPTAIPATSKARQSKIRWAEARSSITKQSSRVRRRTQPTPVSNSNNNKQTRTFPRPQPCIGMAPQYPAQQQQQQMNMATMCQPTINHQMMQQPVPPMQGTVMRQGMQPPMQNPMGNFNFNQPPNGSQMGHFQPFF